MAGRAGGGGHLPPDGGHRSQIWQWRRHGARLADGRPIDAATYCRIREAELEALRAAPPEPGARYEDAAALLDALVLSEALVEFLTIPGMAMLHEGGEP